MPYLSTTALAHKHVAAYAHLEYRQVCMRSCESFFLTAAVIRVSDVAQRVSKVLDPDMPSFAATARV